LVVVGILVRMRIELPNAPGSLAVVASVIADHGGNITAIDVHEGSPGRAVDEMTIEFGDNVDLGEVRRQIGLRASGQVLSHQTASPVDLIVRVLGRLTEALGADDYDKDETLRRGVAALCATPAVWVRSAQDAMTHQAGRLAIEHPGNAMVARTNEALPPLGETVNGEAWLLAVAERRAESPRVVLVARPVTQGFTPTEASRVEALVALHTELDLIRTPASAGG
jgi:hypothetical protein